MQIGVSSAFNHGIRRGCVFAILSMAAPIRMHPVRYRIRGLVLAQICGDELPQLAPEVAFLLLECLEPALPLRWGHGRQRARR
ncbi:MAG: hypothetical protein OXH69_23395 [Acidobacteria bacterium]|nr:hypothetical protein [Acidobacteriota bacterium]